MAGPKWSPEAAAEVLEAAGFEVLSVAPINFGAQLRCAGGVSVSVFTTGKVLCQGRDISRTKALFESATPPAWVPAPSLPRVVAPSPERLPVAAFQPAQPRVEIRTDRSLVRITDYPSQRPEDAGIPPPWE